MSTRRPGYRRGYRGPIGGGHRVLTRAGIGPPAVMVNGSAKGKSRVERSDLATSYDACETERGLQHREVVTDAGAGSRPERKELPGVRPENSALNRPGSKVSGKSHSAGSRWSA